MTESLSDRVVSIALSQVGERERAPNVTTYHDWYDAHGSYKYQGQPWCAIFVCWALDQAGARLPTIQGGECGEYPGAAGVSILRSWFEQQGWMLGEEDEPQPGDIVFFPWSHVGIVVRVGKGYGGTARDSYVVTCEGNAALCPEQVTAEWVWTHLRFALGCGYLFARVPENYSPKQ